MRSGKPWRLRSWFALLVCLAMVAAACTSDDGDDTTTTADGGGTTPGGSPPPRLLTTEMVMAMATVQKRHGWSLPFPHRNKVNRITRIGISSPTMNTS